MPPRKSPATALNAPTGLKFKILEPCRGPICNIGNRMVLAQVRGGLPYRAKPPVVKVAHELHRCLKGKKTRISLATVNKKLKIFKNKSTDVQWLKGVEKNYNHAADFYAYTEKGVTIWLPIKSKGNKIKLDRESPLRKDLERHFGKSAQDTIKKLEQATRTRALTPKEYANTILTADQRKYAIEKVKEKNSNTYISYLAEWLFDDKNWVEFCNGKAEDIKYDPGKKGYIATSFFRTPEIHEIKSWDRGGAKSYVRAIENKLIRQRKEVGTDIGKVLQGPSWFVGVGYGKAGEMMYQVAKQYIDDYAAKWKQLLKITSKQHIVKNRLMNYRQLWEGWGKKVKE